MIEIILKYNQISYNILMNKIYHLSQHINLINKQDNMILPEFQVGVIEFCIKQIIELKYLLNNILILVIIC